MSDSLQGFSLRTGQLWPDNAERHGAGIPP
jgi:hypothetical protein